MTLPNTGPLSFNDSATEFGGSKPYSMSNYYAGGPNVPAGTSGIHGPIPSSGAISFYNFYGASKFTVAVYDFTSGSGTVTIPSGATSVVIELLGGGGGGGYGTTSDGGSGGSAGYVKKTISLVSGNAGQTINYSVGSNGPKGASSGSNGGSGGSSTVTSGTFTLTSLTAGGGGGGFANGLGGSAGSASGGDVNSAGLAGANSSETSTLTSQYGSLSSGAGVGGHGGNFAASVPAGPGSSGEIKFTFT